MIAIRYIKIFVLTCYLSSTLLGENKDFYISIYGYKMPKERHEEYEVYFKNIENNILVEESINGLIKIKVEEESDFYYLIPKISKLLHEGNKKSLGREVLLKNSSRKITIKKFLNDYLDILKLLESRIKIRPENLEDARYILVNGGNIRDALIILRDSGSLADINLIIDNKALLMEKYMYHAYDAINEIRVENKLPKLILHPAKDVETILNAEKSINEESDHIYKALTFILQHGEQKQVDFLKKQLQQKPKSIYKKNIEYTLDKLNKRLKFN